MKTIASLKLDLDLSRGLGDIIEVLKTAAIIQFRSFQLREKPNEDYIKEVGASFGVLAAKGVNHPYLYERPELPSAIMIVTSDEGFLGELNTLLVNAGADQRKNKNDEIVIIGERGARYLEDMGLNFAFFPGFTDEIDQAELVGIRNYLSKAYLTRVGRIFIVYPKFFSMTVQKIEVFPFLPYQRPAEARERPRSVWEEEVLVEPSISRVLEDIVELWAAFKLLEIFWSSKQSEYAARIMHLEGSTQELSHLNQELGFQFIRAVHSLRDKSIREISASKLMLGRK